MWSKPDEYKQSYNFNVTWHSSGGIASIMTNQTHHNITNLFPGRNYTIYVTTETSDGTQGATSQILSCTGMTDLFISCRQVLSVSQLHTFLSNGKEVPVNVRDISGQEIVHLISQPCN